MIDTKYDLCIVGGAGHVGFPLGLVFANSGVKTVLLDINKDALAKIQSGKLPFKEEDGEEALASALRSGNLLTTDNPEAISDSKFVTIIIGTPVDKYLSPQFGGIMSVINESIDYFRDGQIVILRSTVYPGTTEKIQHHFHSKNKKVRLAFCPERIAQGYGIRELKEFPQIISAFDEETLNEVSALFAKITPAGTIPTEPIEAELAKLFTNAWRYIRFAVANQFFMIANEHGLNYRNIEKAMKKDYARNKDLPSPGFAAGPCLFKDTMQLAAFTNNNFWLGHAAMLVNEGLVNHIVHNLKKDFSHSLKEKTMGILGMAFKGESDDYRDSLSYKLRKIAHVECKQVLCTDVYIKDPTFYSLEKVLKESDILILATPHKHYSSINPQDYPDKKIVDIWNFWGLSNGAK